MPTRKRPAAHHKTPRSLPSGASTMSFASMLVAVLFLVIVVRPLVFGDIVPPATPQAMEKKDVPAKTATGAEKKDEPTKPAAVPARKEVVAPAEMVWCCQKPGSRCEQSTVNNCRGGFMDDQKRCDVACVTQ